MSFSTIKINHDWCVEFIENVIESLAAKKLIFKNNKIFDSDKFCEVYWESAGYAKSGLEYTMWAQYLTVKDWCFDDISSSDAKIISAHWIKFIKYKMKKLNEKLT